MGKKGKGKGGKKGGKGGGGKKQHSERYDFINARITIREKSLIEAEAQAAEYTQRLDQMQKTLAIVEKEKDDTIRRLLGKLHRSDDDRADAIMTMNDSIKNRHREFSDDTSDRHAKATDKLAQLAAVQAKNENLENEITKWENYRNEGSKEHDTIIENLEFKLAEQNRNTEAMVEFILKQIETAKTDADVIIRQMEERKREQAVLDALNNLPGSVHECRKSDQLQKLVEWQGSAVTEDRDTVSTLRSDTRKLVREAASLRKTKFEVPRKSHDVLDWKLATKVKPVLPSIEKLALTENVYSTVGENREIQS